VLGDDYRTQLVSDLASIGRSRWDALVAADPDANVFLRHDLLQALHETGCAAPRAGWAPQYLLLWHAERLAGAVPLYAKGHSYGEYVFDWAWAEAYQRAGIDYYPKWLAAVPFTPVGGSRLISADDAARARLADALVELAQSTGMSSLHVLFAPRAQIDLLAARGLMVRHGVQFHWRNAGYADFDAFLAALAQPKRKKIRAERRKVAEAGVRLTRKTGREITHEDWRFFFRCYRHTYATHWSTPYLNLAFFERAGTALAEHMLLVIAERDGHPIAASLGMYDTAAGTSRLYGRYWGTLAEVPCLHFEACAGRAQAGARAGCGGDDVGTLDRRCSDARRDRPLPLARDRPGRAHAGRTARAPRVQDRHGDHECVRHGRCSPR
jgi:uncharacterized protein